MQILIAVTVEKSDGSWPTKNVLATGSTPADCRADAITKAETAGGEGSITRNFQTLGVVDLA